MTLLEMLQFLVLTIVHYLILTIAKIIFLILGEGLTFGVDGSFGSQEKKFTSNFAKAKTKFCLSLHYNNDNSYLFVNRKQIFKFKIDNKSVNFPLSFILEVFLMDVVLLSLEKFYNWKCI